MSKIYKWLLWYIGYTREEGDEDKLSHMLVRQKERLGKWWWVLAGSTLIIVAIILAFLIWLTVHIIQLGRK
jgi:hypothetical protein